ncbi:MAG: type II secretion system F family protein [Clostridiales Family XIII bacterium]|jgi:type IV pilus assembly protein PilC|nr:type II secretion system F family protein [Clostridiales Family XIII bacterium]
MAPGELSVFFSNLKLIYRSGIALDDGLEILQANTDNDTLKAQITRLRAAAADGEPIHMALETMGGVPEYALSLAAIGVETGRMDATMESLEVFYAKRDALNHSIRSALVYPLSMMCMVFVVVLVLLTKAMPVFEQVFAQLGFAMTGLAGFLLGLGEAFSRYTVWICGVLMALVAAGVLMRILPAGRRAAKALFDSSPFTKRLSKELSVQRFALAMSTMLGCGIDWNMALEMARPLMSNNEAAEKVNSIHEGMLKGMSFQTALESSGLFPGSAMTLLSMGIQTGTDADAFKTIGESMALGTERRMERLVAAIEPTMVCIMCILVGMVLLSVMLPILGVLTNM